MLGLPHDALSATTHALAEWYVVGGTLLTTALPSGDGSEEPYFMPASLEVRPDSERSVVIGARFTPTFQFGYEVAEVGASGATNISDLQVG